MFHSQLPATSSYIGAVSASLCAIRVCVVVISNKEGQWPCQLGAALSLSDPALCMGMTVCMPENAGALIHWTGFLSSLA